MQLFGKCACRRLVFVSPVSFVRILPPAYVVHVISHVCLSVCSRGWSQVNKFEWVHVVGDAAHTSSGKRTVDLQVKGFLVLHLFTL